MFEDEEFGSDDSDDDYVPNAGEAVSEEEGSGEEEDNPVTSDVGKDGKSPVKGKRRKSKKGQDEFNRKRTGGICLDEEPAALKEGKDKDEYNKELVKQIQQEKVEKKEEEGKKKADDLWSSFLSSVPTTVKPKPKPATAGLGSLCSISKTTKSSSSTAKSEPKPKPSIATDSSGSGDACQPVGSTNGKDGSKMTITKEFDFAGETVRITKEVDVDSKEAKQELKRKQQEESKTAQSSSILGVKRPGGGGLGSVLGKIGKKPKMGTLEKSKLDWDAFKQKEGIEEELQIHNRGKDGYTEKQAFLSRTDVRQFELEKNLRLANSKR